MVATKSTTTTATAGLGGQPLEVNNNVKQRHAVKTSNNGINNDSDIIKDNHDIAKLDISALSEDIHSSDGNTTSASDVSDNYDRTSEESLNDDDHDVIDSSDGGVDPYADGIEVTGVEQWLCVSRLPPDLTEADFYDLLREFGGVKHYFLVFSEETGLCKGYGLAEFKDECGGLQARHVLHDTDLRGHSIHCEWLKPGKYTQKLLQSKVLYVDELPPGYKDMSQFRKLFSTFVSPPYSQIAMKNGLVQNWGLVEYTTSEQAEQLWMNRDTLVLDGKRIRVQFCAPNIPAINIYMSFINNSNGRLNEKSGPLLEDSPGQSVYTQLQALAKHNPAFLLSLNSIITSNIIREESESKSAVNLVQAATSTAANLAAVAAKLSTTEAASLSTASPPGVTLPGSGSSSVTGGQVGGPGGQSLEAVVASQLKSDPNGKDPQLMNMLYSAFQAFISKQQKQQQQQNPQQVVYSSASNMQLPPASSGPPSMQMAPPLPPPPTTSASTTYSQPPLRPQHQQAPAQHHNPEVVSPPPPFPQQHQQQPPPLPQNGGALAHLQGSPPLHELSHHQISSHDNNNGALLPSPPTHPSAVTACPTLTTHYLPIDATNQLAAAWQFSLAAASAPTHFLYPPQYLPFQTAATVGPLFSQPPMMMHPPPLLETPPPPSQTPIHISASAELYPTAAGGKRKQSLNYFKNSYQSKKLCTGN